MRKTRVAGLFSVFLLLAVLAPFSCVSEKSEEKVVFIDLETVVTEEKMSGNKEKPILLLIDGNIRKASSLAGQAVYRASPFILRRLQIEKVPSLITQEEQKLKVEEIVLK